MLGDWAGLKPRPQKQSPFWNDLISEESVYFADKHFSKNALGKWAVKTHRYKHKSNLGSFTETAQGDMLPAYINIVVNFCCNEWFLENT